MNIWQLSNSHSLMTAIGKFINPEAEHPPKFLKLKPLAWLQRRLSFTPSPKIHDYRGYQSGIDYFFDIAHPSDTAMMTGAGMGIKPLDSFLLLIDGQTCKYQVTEIDYYSNPSDIWIASLKYLGASESA